MSEMSLEASVEARLTNLRAEAQQWRPPPVTIFRVPPFTRKGNPAAYEPRMVSIGPYYRGADGLRTMEDHKWRYLGDLLSRGVLGVSSSTLIQEMRSLEAQVRSCYSEQSLLPDSDNFVQMLLLDGCFILEFFFKRHNKELDVLCDVGWGLTLLISDLLLLENQIPFFAIKKLYDTLTGSNKSMHSLVALGVQGRPTESLLDLFLEHIGDKEPIARPAATDEIQHLLHLYYISYVPRRSPASSGSPDPLTGVIPPATELCKSGVTLVLRRSAQDMFDVSFDGDRGVMEIPAIDVNKGPLLVNLTAFEQSQRKEELPVLSGYMSLMGMLVRTPQDVELLYRRGIVVKPFADDIEETARFFRHLGNVGTTSYGGKFFAVLCEDVQRYCYSSWLHRNRPLEDSMLARLPSVHGQRAQVAPQQFTIFRVPSCFHERNRTAYEPSMVSIGPYFHGSASLRAMEDQKWLHLHSLLRRNPEVQLSTLIKEMQSLEPRARACYSEQPALCSNDFVRMLLLDSSFILESFIDIKRKRLFHIGWVSPAIWVDLFFLLENQIPFFVLERLYSILFGTRLSWESFVTHVAGWLSKGGNGRVSDTGTTDIEIKHLLHLCYISKVPTPSREPLEPAECSMTMYIGELLQRCYSKSSVQERKLEYALPRATEMHEAGVTFKLRTSARDMYDVRFDGAKGIMEIPKFDLVDSSWPKLANLLAFEQTLDRKTWVLKSYVKLMSLMLRTSEDVELLRKRRILVNHLADDEAAAQFFSHLGDGTTFSTEMPSYNNLYDDVHRYCDSWRHKSRAVLMRDYFGTPWKIISILVAAILLTLTAIQTYFTAFPR